MQVHQIRHSTGSIKQLINPVLLINTLLLYYSSQYFVKDTYNLSIYLIYCQAVYITEDNDLDPE